MDLRTSSSDAQWWIGTVVFNHGPWRLHLSVLKSRLRQLLQWEGGTLHFHGCWLITTLHIHQQIWGPSTKCRRALICVRATWHRMIRFRQSEDIYIQRQLSPRLRKQGGQLSSSTSIHYVSITKKTMETDGLTDIQIATQLNPAVVQKCTYCWTIKRLWDFFVWEIFTGWIKCWLFNSMCVWTVTTYKFVSDLCVLQVLSMELRHKQKSVK